MRVLLPTDGAPAIDAVIDAVIAQFAHATTEVRVLNVIDWGREYPESIAYVQGAAAGDHVLALREETRHRSLLAVEHAAMRLRVAGFEVSSAIREGDAGNCILAVAAEWQADTIVMCSHGRHGLDRLITGSVAEFVLRRARCSVEIIRPAVHVDS